MDNSDPNAMEVYVKRLADPGRARETAPWVYEDWLVDASLGRPAA